VYDFLLVINSNLGTEIWRLLAENRKFPHPLSLAPLFGVTPFKFV